MKRHDGKGRTGVREVMFVIFIEAASEPATTLSLISFEPSDPALQIYVSRGHTYTTQDENDETSAISVAGCSVLLLAVAALPIAQ